jgi:hypothetical protein
VDFDGVRWAAIPGPVDYRPNRVPEALRKVSTAARGELDYDGDISFAVGNDHRGTLYPASVPAVAFLLEIIAVRPGPPRQVALLVLLTWWGMFQPDPEYGSYTGDDGRVVDIVTGVMEQVAASVELLRRIGAEDTQARGLVRELLAALDRGWQVEPS